MRLQWYYYFLTDTPSFIISITTLDGIQRHGTETLDSPTLVRINIYSHVYGCWPHVKDRIIVLAAEISLTLFVYSHTFFIVFI